MKNHSFEDELIASNNGKQLFAAMSLGDVVLYLVINEASYEQCTGVTLAVSHAG